MRPYVYIVPYIPRRVYSRLPPHRLDRRERGEGMKKNGYLFNAVLLTATSLILRAAGMVFRVVVAGQVGAEGMGLHQLIFTVYQLFVTLATAGVPIAATRLVTEELAEIYLAQGLCDEAVGIYRKLSLLYPEKSVYFAEIIGRIGNKTE